MSGRKGPEGDLLQGGRREDVRQIVLPPLQRSIHPWRDWRSYRAIRRVVAEFEPDVVHTHSAKAGFLGRLAAHRLRIPAVVHTVHGAPFHDYQPRPARMLFRWCERYAARRCHALVSVADAMTEMLVAAGVAPREKFTTVYSGMDVEPFLQADEHRDHSRLQPRARHVRAIVTQKSREIADGQREQNKDACCIDQQDDDVQRFVIC